MPGKDSQETFIVSLTGAGIDIRREVSARKIALVMNIILKDDLSENTDSKGNNEGGSTALERVSLREFIDESMAATKPDQIVSIGHYMAVYEGKDTFTRDDIKARFQSARERLPSNFPRDFSTAIVKGMVAEDHAKKGQYYVTKTGARAVERRFGAQK